MLRLMHTSMALSPRVLNSTHYSPSRRVLNSTQVDTHFYGLGEEVDLTFELGVDF